MLVCDTRQHNLCRRHLLGRRHHEAERLYLRNFDVLADDFGYRRLLDLAQLIFDEEINTRKHRKICNHGFISKNALSLTERESGRARTILVVEAVAFLQLPELIGDDAGKCGTDNCSACWHLRQTASIQVNVIHMSFCCNQTQ